MPKVLIDDKEVEFTGKANLVDLAEKAGAVIPHFCYHPGLSVSGNCRMCLVEVGMPVRNRETGAIEKDENGKDKISFIPKLQPACYQPPSDGMVVRTNTEKVIEARRGIMEFLLANHPLDCPVCDQAGECVLQDYSFSYGSGNSRFLEEKRTYIKTNFSDVITPELNRCIHCDRCARFTDEIVHDLSFTRTGRGNHTELAALPGEKITHNYQGNMVDICPVGALTLTDFRFKSRVWFLRNVESLCASCGKGCNVVMAISNANSIMRLKPRHNEKVNSYWMCDYGRLRYNYLNVNKATVYRKNGQKSKMEETLESCVGLIKKSDKIAVLASASETLESMITLTEFCRDGIKTPHVDYRLHKAQIDDNRSLKKGELLLAEDPYPNSAGARKAELLPTKGGMKANEFLDNPDKFDLLIAIVDDRILADESLIKKISAFRNKIILSPYESELSENADFLIPVANYTEQDGTFINIDGIEQRFHRVITPGPHVITTGEFFRVMNESLRNVAAGKPA